MKKLLSATFALSIFLFFELVSAAPITLRLSLGESRPLPLNGSSAVWIQNSKIIKAESSSGRLLVKALTEGQSALRLGNTLYQVEVFPPIKLEAFTQFKKIIDTLVGLSLEYSNADLEIKGRLYRLQDWEKIAQFAQAQGLTYQMKAHMSPSLQKEMTELMQKKIIENNLPPQTLIFSANPEVRIKSNALSEKKYREIYTPYGIQIQKDETALEIAPTVKVEITVAEIKKNLSRKWGVQWPTSYAATLMTNGAWDRDSLSLQFTGAEDNGDAKILASPNILCRSGQEAEFLAGGEFPIKVIGYKSESVSWRRYGISLKVKPQADSSGRISLSIETEITSLDKATTVDNIPGLRINKVSSHFDITKPQTIALSGLLRNEDGESSKGLPWLSQIPILGALFSSKDFLENKSELIIFVRPSVLKEDSVNTSPHHLQEPNQ